MAWQGASGQSAALRCRVCPLPTSIEVHGMRATRAPDLVAGLLLVAPAIPMNNPEGNTWSRGGSSLGSKLRLGLTRAILQARHPIKQSYSLGLASWSTSMPSC